MQKDEELSYRADEVSTLANFLAFSTSARSALGRLADDTIRPASAKIGPPTFYQSKPTAPITVIYEPREHGWLKLSLAIVDQENKIEVPRISFM